MAGASMSTVATRLNIGGNQAAIAAAIGGGVVAADVASLGAILSLLALSQDIMIPLIGQATTPANASTMLNPA